MNNWVDTHAHIYESFYENITSIIKNAEQAGIKYIINAGCDNKSNQEVLKSLKHDIFYGVIGIHPENVTEFTLEDINFIEQNISNPKIVGIGEIGLDYHYRKDLRQEQIKLLETQLALASKYHLPVVIHCREAHQDVLNSLKKYQVTGVIHSFSGTLEEAKAYLDLGFYLGVNGIITFKNADLASIIKEIPLERLLLETDSPYLTPHPFRGQKNEPKHVCEIAEFLAQLKNISLDELAKITRDNVKNLFNI